MALFKAHPVHVGAPFQVIKGLKPLTEVSHFELNSDARAVQRQKFENDKSEKAKAAEEVRKLQEEEQRVCSFISANYFIFIFVHRFKRKNR
jgi:hypothetical protein